MFPTLEYVSKPYHQTFPDPQTHYAEKVAEYQEKMEGNTSWCHDWVPEPLPLENKEGDSMNGILDAANYLKLSKAAPTPGEPKPPMNILVFPDRGGITEEILSYAPPGRVTRSKLTMIKDEPSEITPEYLRKLMKTSWDLIIFGMGLNKPQKSSTDSLLECQNEFTQVYLKLAQSLVDPCEDGLMKGAAILTRGCFSQDAELHNNGVGVISGGNLFGMTNSVRAELAMPMQYVEMDWFPSETSLRMVAAEIFRAETLGMNTVRIHNDVRYVQREFLSSQYEKCPVQFEVPDEGVVAVSGGNGAVGIIIGMYLMTEAEKAIKAGKPKKFSVKFLSRSTKVPEESQKTWKECQVLAAKLGIHVEQARCDVGNREAVNEFVKSQTPNLVAFIHSAGVLRDSMLPNQTWQKYEEVYNSKHRPALYLYDALDMYRNPNFQFTWFFSSDSVYGNASATNYSGSNSFLDALSRHMNATGIPHKKAMSVQWGSWGEVGMAANLSAPLRARINQSFHPLGPTADMLRGLDGALRSGLPVCAVNVMNTPVCFAFASMGDQGDSVSKIMRSMMSTLAPIAPTQEFSYKSVYSVFRTLQFIEDPVAKRDPSERLDYRALIVPRLEQDDGFCWGPVEDDDEPEDE
mmetsp:Transcript_71200/g.123594  ORF Transcript_71200/g.123594 Transcript_71200/m.123594 type:complete len:632 (-) Transcript_71200:102-1997(-)